MVNKSRVEEIIGLLEVASCVPERCEKCAMFCQEDSISVPCKGDFYAGGVKLKFDIIRIDDKIYLFPAEDKLIKFYFESDRKDNTNVRNII